MATGGKTWRIGFLQHSFVTRWLSLTLVLSSAMSNLQAELPANMSGWRVATANLTSGRYQSYDEGHGIRIMQALQADIILVQEWNYKGNSTADIRSMVDMVCGVDCDYFREEGSQFQIPNGIISRFPIKRSGSFGDPVISNRGFAWAEIAVSGGGSRVQTVLAVSVHFSAKHESKRSAEAKAILEDLDALKPGWSEDAVILGGDFNTGHASERTVEILEESFGPLRVAACPEGKTGTNQSRSKPYDLIFETTFLDELVEPVAVGPGFPEGLVVDTRSFGSDHELISPATTRDSAASQMQHQAVIRDFNWINR